MALYDMILQMVLYLVALVFGVAVMAFLQSGYFWPWLVVRASREGKVLVKIRGAVKDRFRVGRIAEGFLVFRDGKQNRRIRVQNRPTYKAAGVQCVDVDDESNAIVLPDFSVVSGFDAVAQENLHVRTMQEPQPLDKVQVLILVCVLVAAAAAVLGLYFNYQLGLQVEQLSSVAQAVGR